ncbi:MAG: DMT family transporter, partial [Schwartzia sp.]|nr:DMT family transporter [Schwartzia sp. (in: firmicutes)]
LLGRKIRSLVWLCVIIAAAGFYFLCIKEDFTAETGDIFILASTLFYSVHIYVIDHFLMHNADAIKMSWVQFGAQAAGASVIALIFETPQLSSVMEAFPSIAYAGVLSSGVAFTLQNLGQKYMDDASVATLLMSLESVFAVLTGWAVLGEVLTPREIFGCVLVFAAVLLAQKPQKIEIGQ